MLKRFFIWRATRKMNPTRYRMDRRKYRGVFTPGFMADLNREQFWQARQSRFSRGHRIRRRILWITLIIVALVIAWMVVQSLQAIRLF